MTKEMTKELTIKELIAQQVEINEKKEEEKKKAKEQEEILKAQQKAIKKQQIEQQKVVITKFRNDIFNNCCEVLEECVGLEVSKKFEKPKYMQKFDFEGEIKFALKPSETYKSLCRAVLKANKREIFVLNVSNVSNKTVGISVAIFVGRASWSLYSLVGFSNGYKPVYTKQIRCNAKDLEDTKKNIYSAIKNELVAYLSQIVVNIDTTKQVPRKKKISKKEESIAPEFKFINLK